MLEIKFGPHLLRSIRIGANEVVLSHIERYNLYKTMDRSSNTLLHYSAKYGNEIITKLLLRKGCPVDFKNNFGKTALVVALENNQEKIIKILLNTRADVNISVVERINRKAIHFFAANDKMSPDVQKIYLQALGKKFPSRKNLAKEMISAGCQIDQVVCLGDPVVSRYMLEHGCPSSSRNFHNRTGLHSAVLFGDIEHVKLLLEFGVDVNAVDNDGATPLYYLYEESEENNSEKFKILEVLINSGASLTSCTRLGLFQITFPLFKGNRETIRLILQSNIDFSAKAPYLDRNILHALVMNRNPGVVEELKNYVSKFDLNAVDSMKASPLTLATICANVPIVKFLLEHSVDSNLAQKNGFPPLYYAYAKSKVGFESKYFENQYDQCAELLLQANCNPQFIGMRKNGQQVTIFDVAAETNKLHKVKSVVAYIANIEALGTPISEIIYEKINSHEELKKYFSNCKRMLRRKIFGPITVLELLSGNEKKIAAYFNNKKSMFELERMKSKLRVISYYSHYYITIKKRLSKATHDKIFNKKASKIVCKILQNRLCETHLVVHNIVKHLKHEDLYELCKI